jgi:hypothetical protein
MPYRNPDSAQSRFVEPRKHIQRTRSESGPESENHAFVLRYRREPAATSEAPARTRIDLEYVNENQRWRYAALDEALARITEVIDSLPLPTNGPEIGRN